MQVDANIGFKAPEVIADMRKITDLPIDSIAIIPKASAVEGIKKMSAAL